MITTTTTTLTAKKLIVTAKSPNHQTTYDFIVWEFGNGAIMVPSDTTNDWFFDSREEIEANGGDLVESVEETSTLHDWSVEDIRESIEGSEAEFSNDAGKIKELL